MRPGDAHKRLRQVEYRTQAPDHPILMSADESYYLKFIIFQVVDENKIKTFPGKQCSKGQENLIQKGNGTMAIDLLQLRDQLDDIDEQIVHLYEKRMDICREVAEYKIENGKQVLDKERRNQAADIESHGFQ